MKILTAVQAEYGKRIAENLSKRLPGGWSVETISLPRALPVLIDEPEEFLPSEIPAADLLVALIESDGAAQLVPALAKMAGVNAAIVPVDNPSWLPPGLQTQIEHEMLREGISAVFPRTFCTLTEKSAGFRDNAVPYDNPVISAFARYFGRPCLKLTLDSEGKTIEAVSVERGAPCGSTRHVAEKIAGMAVEEVVPRAGLIAHQYPCLASMQQEEIDKGVFEPFMNISGYVVNDEVEKELKSTG